ncbi:MAG TPA: hypothetical protein PKE69_21305 [Pyrinomonadaceae bacterium]|nr:hypothetical protein [Pyrinomonadaceae bacterium]
MNNEIKLNQLGKLATSVFFAIILSFCAIVSANAQMEDTDSTDKSDFYSYDLTGSWEVTVTPDEGEPFVGFYSFNSDGIASFASAGPPIPGLGNPGYGAWKRVGRNRFASTIKMNSYTSDFQFDGTVKINATIRMPSRDVFITQDEVTIYDPNGKVIVMLGGSAQGRRIKVDD